MRIVFFVAFRILNIAIEAITLLMFARAVLSFFPAIDRSSKIMSFIYGVTEAVISPVRKLLERFDFVKRFPLDISFLVTYLILHLLQIALMSLYSR